MVHSIGMVLEESGRTAEVSLRARHDEKSTNLVQYLSSLDRRHTLLQCLDPPLRELAGEGYSHLLAPKRRIGGHLHRGKGVTVVLLALGVAKSGPFS